MWALRHCASLTPVIRIKMGNEMSDQKKSKGKLKEEAPRNVPDGEAIKSEEEDQTGSQRSTDKFRRLFALKVPPFRL